MNTVENIKDMIHQLKRNTNVVYDGMVSLIFCIDMALIQYLSEHGVSGAIPVITILFFFFIAFAYVIVRIWHLAMNNSKVDVAKSPLSMLYLILLLIFILLGISLFFITAIYLVWTLI